MTVMAFGFGLLIQLLPLGLLIWVIREVWRKGRRDFGKNAGRTYSQPSRSSWGGQMQRAYGQAARNRQARQLNSRQNMPGQNRQARQANSRQNMPGQNRAAQQAYSRQSGLSRNKAAQQEYVRQSRNEARMRKEDPEESALMDKVYDLMITGYSGDLKFERDFLSEGMDMLNRIRQ